MQRISFNDGMRAQIAKEIVELDRRLTKTRNVVKGVEVMDEKDIDDALRG